MQSSKIARSALMQISGCCFTSITITCIETSNFTVKLTYIIIIKSKHFCVCEHMNNICYSMQFSGLRNATKGLWRVNFRDSTKTKESKGYLGSIHIWRRMFFGYFWPTYPNQILYYISLFSKIRCSLTYLPKNLTSYVQPAYVNAPLYVSLR